MNKEQMQHNLRLIKNNNSINEDSKKEVFNMVDFFLETASSKSDIEYVMYRLNLIKDKDIYLQNSFAFNQILEHIRSNM